ncbi:MAG TPA: SOS response-associated peptidase [Acidimicrobiales bacterium]|nr:SOS response-associated peptidase [Acidimicrobiales bacterium]
MCGRYVSSLPAASLAAYLRVDEIRSETLAPNWNVAPTDQVMTAATSKTDGLRKLGTMRWGLVPSWAKDVKVGAKMINARADTLLTKPAFRNLVARRRCIIPADGFYEWLKRDDGTKQPVFIRRRDGDPMAFAGLWDVWRDRDDPDAEWIRSCTIITTDANTLVAPVHDRMPVLVAEESWDAWLDPTNADTTSLTALLQPAEAELLELWPVGDRVNSVRNNGPELIAPDTTRAD